MLLQPNYLNDDRFEEKVPYINNSIIPLTNVPHIQLGSILFSFCLFIYFLYFMHILPSDETKANTSSLNESWVLLALTGR